MSNTVCVVTANVINSNDIDNPTTLIVGVFANEVEAMNALKRTPFELPDGYPWDSIEYGYHTMEVGVVMEAKKA